MKTVRKRQIVRIMQRNATKLMSEYFHNERIMAMTGVMVISEEREFSIIDTLSSYAHILDRNFKWGSKVYSEEWAMLVRDFY